MIDDEIVDRVIEREVGPAVFQELLTGERANAVHRDPADRGGTTNMGITCAGLSRMLGRPATDADVAGLTLGRAREFYRWLLASFGLDHASGVDAAVRELAFDMVVNHGNAVQLIQRALGVKVDGVFGRITRAKLFEAEPRRLYRELGAQRLEYIGRLISDQLHDDDKDGVPDNAEQAAGWLKRQADFWRVTP